MAKKQTAAQRRMRKQAEKLARALYQAGKRPAAAPKRAAAKRAAREEIRQAQIHEAQQRNMSSEEVAKLSKQDAAALLRDLHDQAYRRYYALMQQGTPNAATAIYESDFAGLNPDGMTVNAIRAKIAALQKWLLRKDVSPKRARKKQQKDLEWLRDHGFPDVTEDELEDFYDMYAKYLEYAGYGKHYITGRLANFANVYAQLEDPSLPDALKKIDEEMRRQYELDTGDQYGGLQLSGGSDVQHADSGPVAAPGAKQPRPPRSNRKRKSRKKVAAQRKSAKLAARKAKRKRKKGR